MAIKNANSSSKHSMVMSKTTFPMGNGCKLVARETEDGKDQINNERSDAGLWEVLRQMKKGKNQPWRILE